MIRTSQNGASVHSFRLQLLMEEAQKLEMAERIRELRERSPYTQPEVADKLGIGLRAYQKLEAKGTIRWERAEELAAIYEVAPRWIWDGSGTGETPDVLSGLDGSVTERLSRIEERLDAIVGLLGEREVEELEQDEAAAAERSAPSEKRSARAKNGSG